MKLKLVIIALFLNKLLAFGQANVIDFYGKQIDKNICERVSSLTTDRDISNLIDGLLSKYGVKNRFIILNCPSVSNCVATVDKTNRPYILYNANFLESVKKFSFTQNNLPKTNIDWKTLTILAHEIGHHLNNHLSNPLPNATIREMELEADETAGYIMYLNKATLEQAQQVMYSPEILEEGSFTHPPRKERLEAIRKGFENAAENNSNGKNRTVAKSEILNALTLHVDVDFNDVSANSPNQHRYRYYLEGPQNFLNLVKEVRYTRRHNTFYEFPDSYISATNEQEKFIVKQYQWGCIKDVYVQLIYDDGEVSDRIIMPIKYDNIKCNVE